MSGPARAVIRQGPRNESLRHVSHQGIFFNSFSRCSLSTRMLTYQWVCHICGHVNEPRIPLCEKCDFPALASGFKIERMRRLMNSAEVSKTADLHLPKCFQLFSGNDNWKWLIGAYIVAVFPPALWGYSLLTVGWSLERMLTCVFAASLALLLPYLSYRRHIKGKESTTNDARGLGIAIGCNIFLLLQAWSFYAGWFGNK